MTRTAIASALLVLHVTFEACAGPLPAGLSREPTGLSSTAPRHLVTAPPAALHDACCVVFDDPGSRDVLGKIGLGAGLLLAVGGVVLCLTVLKGSAPSSKGTPPAR